MIDTKIIADSPEPVFFSALTKNDTNMPAINTYTREDTKEIKKYFQIASSKKKNTVLAIINPTYNTPATFHMAFALRARKNGTDSVVITKKKATWYKGWRSKSKTDKKNIGNFFSFWL